jgi:hypothetical protein
MYILNPVLTINSSIGFPRTHENNSKGKNWRKKLLIFTRSPAILAEKNSAMLFFKKITIFAKKWLKFAKDIDHNVNLRLRIQSFLL